MPSEWAKREIEALEAGWRRIWDAIERLGEEGLERPTSAGWTAKEMFAHIAFWEETITPVVEMMYRGGPEIPVEEWYGGDGLELAPGEPWPGQDTHNAREARWARSRTNGEVIARLRKVHDNSVAVMSTITDEEGRGDIGRQWSGENRSRHFDEHLAELALDDASGVTG
jgi:hypothetical protein